MFSDTGSDDSAFKTFAKIYVPNSAFSPDPLYPSLEGLLADIARGLGQHIDTHNNTSTHTFNLPTRQRACLKALANNKDLFFVPADKNLGPCIMLKEQYISFCIEHLKDTSTYRRVSHDPSAQLRQTVLDFYENLEQHAASLGILDSLPIIIHELEEKGLAYFYAMPKLHKNPIKPRPIVASTGAIFHGLSKWVDFFLQKKVTHTSTYLRNSSDLVSLLSHFERKPHHILVSFDATSLFTTIPLAAALPAIRHYFKNEPLLCSFILKALEIINSNNYFTFGDLTFLQLVGTAMGTPSASNFANLYLAYYEETLIIPEFRSCISLIRRFLDDGFLIWDPSQSDNPFELSRFYGYLHKIPGIAWTILKATSLPYMDIEVYPLGNRFATKSYAKPLNLYLFLPPSSAHPPGILKGHVFGQIKKLYHQNTKFEDFKHFALLFFRRLVARGNNREGLIKLFNQALLRHCPTVEVLCNGHPIPRTSVRTPQRSTSMETKLFFKIPYDPNGPTRHNLRHMLRTEELESSLRGLIHRPKVTIAYQRTRSIKQHLRATKLSALTEPRASQIYEESNGNSSSHILSLR